jgi:large subunit ribosomal protein L15
MNLHTLKPNPGAKRRVKRLGCGESSGHGKTCCKGNKGQKARSGGTLRPGFEGGQMPLHRRLPKKGFNNIDFRTRFAIVNVGQLNAAFSDGDAIDETALRAKGLVKGRYDAVKVLGNGELAKKLAVSVDAVSASARGKIEQAGGTVTTPGAA